MQSFSFQQIIFFPKKRTMRFIMVCNTKEDKLSSIKEDKEENKNFILLSKELYAIILFSG